MSELPPELQADDLPGALFGYDRYTIVKMLDRLRARFQELWQERLERDDRIRELEHELLRSRRDEQLIGETLVAARQEALAIREEARRSAESVLRAARRRAERMIEEAEREYRSTAKELLGTAERERRAMLEEAGRARAFVEQTHEQLSDFLLAAVNWYEQAQGARGEEAEAAGGERAGFESSGG